MCRKISVGILYILLVYAQAMAQDVQSVRVNGHFLVDSIKIGEQVPFSLTSWHLATTNVLFPDSSFSFSPFEFRSKKYFQTKTTNNISYDSVVYFLTTFEIDSLQILKLPVFEVHKKDCTAIYSAVDTIILKQLVRQRLDSIEAPALPLKVNTSYQAVKWLLDYPFLLALGGGLLVVLVIVWIIFGKRIRNYFKIRKLSKSHEAFLSAFGSSLEQLKANFSPQQVETVVVLWKNYLEKLNAKPYTKFTTKEIMSIEKDERLGHALNATDKMIYGSNASSSEVLNELRAYATSQFANKLKEINHG